MIARRVGLPNIECSHCAGRFAERKIFKADSISGGYWLGDVSAVSVWLDMTNLRNPSRPASDGPPNKPGCKSQSCNTDRHWNARILPTISHERKFLFCHAAQLMAGPHEAGHDDIFSSSFIDGIDLAKSIYTVFGPTVTANELRLGKSTLDSNDHLICDKTTG
jgi:hypothetical protein